MVSFYRHINYPAIHQRIIIQLIITLTFVLCQSLNSLYTSNNRPSSSTINKTIKMRSTIAVSIFALSASVLAAPTPQNAALSGLVGGLTSTVGSVTNPSAGSDNLISGNGNNNGQNNGNGNSAGNANGNNNQAGTGNAAGNGNSFNLRPLGGILGNAKRGLPDTVNGVPLVGPIAGGLTDGKGGLLNGVTVGPTTDSLTKGLPVVNGLVGRGLTDSLDLNKLNQAQLLSLLGQVTGALQTNSATSGVTGTLTPVTGATKPVTDAVKPVTGAVKPVTGATGGLTSGLLKRQGNLLGDVTGTVNGVVGTLSTTAGSVTGATAGSGNSLLNNGNSNGQGNGVSVSISSPSYDFILTSLSQNNNQAGNGNGNGNSAGTGNSAGNNNDFNVSPETELPDIDGPLVTLPDVNVAPVIKSV